MSKPLTRYYVCPHDLEEVDDGEYVAYEDHRAEVERLEREKKHLADQAIQVVVQINEELRRIEEGLEDLRKEYKGKRDSFERRRHSQQWKHWNLKAEVVYAALRIVRGEAVDDELEEDEDEG